MTPIKLLPPQLINKIAAGEVIVRPASAVKELVENSLDAGATRIAIQMTNGCRDIVVEDDGCGMSPEDARMALERHATSKIASLADLEQVRTSGFRGEAVPSMASVARMKMLTRPADSDTGTYLELEGGEVVTEESRGGPAGTRIELRDLFFNVPARRKFMKSTASELQQTLAIVSRIALANPEVTFRFHSDGRERFHYRSTDSPRERATQILGGKYRESLLPVLWPKEGRAGVLEGTKTAGAPPPIRIHGFIATPSHAMKTRQRQYFFANGRPISNRRLSAVLQQAFHGLLMTRQFPVAVLFVEVDPERLDVNIHPTKEEVRFADENAVAGALYRAVREALNKANLLREMDLGSAENAPGEKENASRSDSENKIGTRKGYTINRRQLDELRSTWAGPNSSQFKSGISGKVSEQGDIVGADPARLNQEAHSPENQIDDNSKFEQGRRENSEISQGEASKIPGPPPAESDGYDDARQAEIPFFDGPEPEPLGQVGDTYILAATGEGVLLIDQHAAHERLLYERLRKRPKAEGRQTLLVPVAVDLPPDAAAGLEAYLPALNEVGIEVEPFGGNTFVVQTVPADLPDIDLARLLGDLAETLGDSERPGEQDDLAELHHAVQARLACRAAIKAGQRLSREEMTALLRDMRAERLPFACPHGRPTMLLLTRDQLDRRFGRMG